MRKLILISTLIPALALANPSAPDNMPHHGGFDGPGFHHFKHGFKKGEHLPPFLHDIGLTDQQREAIKALVKDKHETMREHWNQERDARRALRALSFSETFTEEQAMPLIEQSLARHREIALQKARVDHEIFKLLTPEQREKVKAKQAQDDD